MIEPYRLECLECQSRQIHKRVDSMRSPDSASPYYCRHCGHEQEQVRDKKTGELVS